MPIPRVTPELRRNRRIVLFVYPYCYLCGAPATEVDHGVPFAVAEAEGWTAEETHGLDNLLPVCSPCNKARGADLLSPALLAYVEKHYPPVSPAQATAAERALT